MYILLVVLVILIALSAFFSSIETAFMSISVVKARALARKGRKNADILLELRKDPKKLLITILIGNNLVNIAATSVTTAFMTSLFGSTGVGIATGLMTLIILTFGEIVPKSYATQNAVPMALFAAKPIKYLSIILFPVVLLFEKLSTFVNKSFSKEKKERALSEEEIKTIVTMGYEEGVLSKEVAEMMKSLVEFSDKNVDEVMTPKSEICFVDGRKTIRQVLDYVTKTPYSRYPVFIRDDDNVIGLVDIDDILKYVKRGKLNVKVKDIVRPVEFVPESKKLNELLVDFYGKDAPMAMVVDEYGNILGLVTLQDILEEIVGDIFDKSKSTEVMLRRVGKNVYKADALLPLDDFEDVLKIPVKEEHFNTLAGLIEHKLRRIPRRGESIDLGNAKIVVTKASKRRILEVKIIKKK